MGLSGCVFYNVFHYKKNIWCIQNFVPQLEDLIKSTRQISRDFLSVVITGFAQGSLIVMYTVSVDEDSTLTPQELSEDIEDAVTSNPDSGLTVKPGSLSVEEGKINKIIFTQFHLQRKICKVNQLDVHEEQERPAQ